MDEDRASGRTDYFDPNFSKQGKNCKTCDERVAVVYRPNAKDEYDSNHCTGEDLGHLREQNISVAYIDGPGLMKRYRRDTKSTQSVRTFFSAHKR